MLAEDAGYLETLAPALELEEKATAFYQNAAGRSESLLATIPAAFTRAGKNGKRLELELRSFRS